MVHSITGEDTFGNARAGMHIVHFYRRVEQMVQAACRYVAEGLQRGEAVLIVATRAHWDKMVGRLAAQPGVDIVDAVMHGQLRHLDAEIVLSGLLERGMPDANRFREQASDLIERATSRFGNVRIFTELAGMLWESGNRLAAFHLERLWNALAERLPFALMCTYRSGANAGDGYNASLQCVCKAHSHMIPDGSSGEIGDADALKKEWPGSP